MFHKEFYPTPPEVILMMDLDPKNKVILEPQAGKGDIIDYCKNSGAKEVLAFEINEDLQQIVKQKAKLMGDDFFACTPEQISHINAIYMNPPFSNADKHILHAWKVAPEGCEIISLCNYETIAKEYSNVQLSRLIRDYGISENLGDCFTQAERTTGVEIGLIKLYKPITSAEFNFDGFFTEEDEEEQGKGIMQYNEVRAVVNRYKGVMQSFDQMKQIIENINYNNKSIGIPEISLELGYNKNVTNKEEFGKEIQRRSWHYIFSKMNLEKYVTSGVQKDINRFVEQQTKIPFTMRNIYKMIEIIHGTKESRFKQTLEEVIDSFTKHTHENRFGVEGWKTNSGYMLNQKFIIEYVVRVGYSGKLEIESSRGNFEKLKDLTKVICNIIGHDYNSIPDIRFSRCNLTEEGYLTANGYRAFDYRNLRYNDRIMWENDFQTNTWYKWAFFEFKVFKKGTMHLKFQNKDVWYRLNKAYGELKGFSLPQTYKK